MTAYRVLCGITFRGGCLSEWHVTLASAQVALADHQQRHWDWCALVPVPERLPCLPPPTEASQLALAFGGEHPGTRFTESTGRRQP